MTEQILYISITDSVSRSILHDDEHEKKMIPTIADEALLGLLDGETRTSKIKGAKMRR